MWHAEPHIEANEDIALLNVGDAEKGSIKTIIRLGKSELEVSKSRQVS